jgi:hypothetical protein
MPRFVVSCDLCLCWTSSQLFYPRLDWYIPTDLTRCKGDSQVAFLLQNNLFAARELVHRQDVLRSARDLVVRAEGRGLHVHPNLRATPFYLLESLALGVG